MASIGTDAASIAFILIYSDYLPFHFLDLITFLLYDE